LARAKGRFDRRLENSSVVRVKEQRKSIVSGRKFLWCNPEDAIKLI
jgi:hypothetical protein